EKETITTTEKVIINGVETEKEVTKEQNIQKKYYLIIPVFEEQGAEFPIPIFSSGSNWPVIEDKEVEQFRSKVKKRVEAILLNTFKLKGKSKVLIWIGARVILNSKLAEAALTT